MKRPFVRFTTAAVLAASILISTTVAADRMWSGTPLQPVRTPMPPFPAKMHQRGVTHGEVEFMIEVSPSGEVTDVLMVAYTRREFAEATKAAVNQWRFRPTEFGHVVQITFNFETRGILAFVKQFDPESEVSSRYAYRPCPPDRLDQRPRPVETVQPLYAPSLAAQGAVGAVTIDYFIDETGRVRMPVAGTAAHPLLAGLAIDALKQWRFEPPTCEGRPALVRARQSFRFGESDS